ncbi:MAG: peptidoglycan editing factor PgeF [Paracoccus sp. (in: a-proteobacteria)]|uniref:peptidoglycan editing factor PgeF n=1 Tax=unclassified Paracoccus (in: a-proteobacteria) TaxID=2688777 RepID=UPI000C46E413|nr:MULTISPECIES: peptidoglycan editing factor PgeF [unclassified Paracoccus (in: a-proteobacteria)]MAN57801.1 polyphenol oxidase [Paracoccus sp. (in: a-proteobacteria)]MCS5603659.1 peptidoglycan editing factor PgeF [Paracoccus sp. (in: a-proteobacteria)]|tara:strand:+ start:389 stop:1153 length:765 start_codon:yes stop_codon:yes gene_type:complete
MQTTLEILNHPLLSDVRHGFFTRKGGASSGLFAGLNCGRRSSDQADMVRVNRGRVAQAMGVPAASLATVKQVHSADVVTLAAGEDVEAIRDQRADGIVTARRDVALAVLTADCQPILLADPQAGVIGACHAGWRGALSGVIEATVAAMRALGATQIRAVIGPSISQRAYEVGQDFMEDFLLEDPDYHRFFAGGPNGKPMFDLPSFGLSRLRAAGVEAEWSGHCTYSDPARFFSYRRATHEGQADYGRLISAIAL